MEWLLVAGLLYLAWQSGALTPLGVAPPPAAAPQNVPAGLQPNVTVSAAGFGAGPVVSQPIRQIAGAQQTTGVNTIGLASTAITSVGTAAVSTPASFAALGLTGAAAGAAVAGIGAAVAIAAALYAAHLARVKQAKDENSAMNIGVQGVDADMRTINQAYNARQITAQDAIKLLPSVMANYWNLVTPHIQPGRNGCSSGNACPPWPASGNGCSGSIGAACCVGCYDLAGGASPAVLQASDGGDGVHPIYFGVEGAMQVVRQGGGVSAMQMVYGSKYGGQNRTGYRITWAQIAA